MLSCLPAGEVYAFLKAHTDAPDFQKPFLLMVDASNTVAGVVLMLSDD